MREPLSQSVIRSRLEPGQFFRNTDSQGCRYRIKNATTADLSDLKAALLRESNSKRRRSRLVRALSVRISELANGGQS